MTRNQELQVVQGQATLANCMRYQPRHACIERRMYIWKVTNVIDQRQATSSVASAHKENDVGKRVATSINACAHDL